MNVKHSINKLLSFFRQLHAISDVQNALNSYGVVTSVLEHLSRPQDEVVREVLGFMAALIFNGNESVQVCVQSPCTNTRVQRNITFI